MSLSRNYIKELYFTSRFYAVMAICSLLFLCRFFLPWLGSIPYILVGIVFCLTAIDYLFLFFIQKGIHAVRTHAERFSNGDENPVRITINNFYAFPVSVEVVDEIPHQFQKRDVLFTSFIIAGGNVALLYHIRPVNRGVYAFGTINTFAKTPIGFTKRRYKSGTPVNVAVYPSYMQMRKYQLMAIHDRLSEMGVRTIRRIGHSMEFDHTKEYVVGDDYRTVNWKATARRGQLMVNHYTDEKSQQIYCIIDKGRVMKMPFDGMSLLDYAVNASLVLSNVALLKQDKAGLIFFSEDAVSFLAADKKIGQMNLVLESLYSLTTRYMESDYERLYMQIHKRITQRSLVVLFTNFESMSGMKRQLPFLRKIAKRHLLLVIFFENTELKQLVEEDVTSVRGVYTQTIAEKFAYEKQQIVKELQRHGILSMLTAPRNVTVNAVNKYLELKSRQAI